MNFFKQCVVIAALFVPLALESRKKEADCSTRYVKGGACAPFKGTREHPEYGTLQQAQGDLSWDVLVVLASDIPLDGGITLRPHTKLLGEIDPTRRGSKSPLAIITNSSAATNDGHGAVAVGDSKIENIYFKNTYRSGIKYDQATDIRIRNVLVAGFGVELNYVDGGIDGRSSQSGSTCIENVVDHNPTSSTAVGIVEAPQGNAQRRIKIDKAELHNIPIAGIVLSGDGAETLVAHINNCYIHNCGLFSLLNRTTTSLGASLKVSVCNTTFEDTDVAHIFNPIIDNGELDLLVSSCSFSQTQLSGRAIRTDNSNSISDHRIENCTSNNVEFFAVLLIFDTLTPSTQKASIVDNNVFGGTFAFIQNTPSASVSGQQTVISALRNNFTGGKEAWILAPGRPWLLLDITAKNNCFQGTGQGITSNPGNVGTGTFTAQCNNFEGFAADLVNLSDFMKYSLSKNWWGPATSSCVNGPCPTPQYQTCIEGSCFGPDNVFNSGTGTTIDTSNPLTEAITCPHHCCQEKHLLSRQSVADSSTVVTAVPHEMAPFEKIERLVN